MTKVWKDFFKSIREYREKYDPKVNPTKANILVNRIMSGHRTAEEYYAVRDDALAFLKSDASLEDKQYVRGHLESLNMIISAIEQGLLDIPLK